MQLYLRITICKAIFYNVIFQKIILMRSRSPYKERSQNLTNNLSNPTSERSRKTHFALDPNRF